jgi:hypothetical protein
MLNDIKITPLIESIKLLDISDEEYFGSEYADYISNSRLKLINPDQDGSPSKYRDGLSSDNKYSDSLYFGSAVHELVLQPESFVLVESVNRPTAKAGFMADELFLAFVTNHVVTVDEIIAASDKIGYYKGKMDDDKADALRIKCEDYYAERLAYEWGSNYDSTKVPIYLDAKSRDKLQECIASVASNAQIQSLLKPDYLLEEPISKNESVLLMDVLVEHDGKSKVLKLKAKLDNFTYSPESNELVLNDLKTTGKWLCHFHESFETYHYARQMAMYMWMLKLYIEREYKVQSTMKANMLLVSTVPDFRSGVYPVLNGMMRDGFLEFTKLLRLVAYYELYGYDADGAL